MHWAWASTPRGREDGGGVSERSPESRPLDPETRERVDELEGRIRSLEAQPEDDFGHFTRWDWACCILGGLLVPVFAVWFWAP